jgi:hypothetical protein
MMRFVGPVPVWIWSPRQLLQELLLIQPILEGLAPVDKYDRHFVGELAPKQVIGFYVNFPPPETAPALQFRELLFDDFAQMASLAGVNDDFAKEGHFAGV